jgi:hypothetical protein
MVSRACQGAGNHTILRAAKKVLISGLPPLADFPMAKLREATAMMEAAEAEAGQAAGAVQ